MGPSAAPVFALACRLLAHLGLLAGGEALWVFCCCAAATHLLSSLTHVYPDDHFLEKLDHIGIVALIVGTPLTQMMVSGFCSAAVWCCHVGTGARKQRQENLCGANAGRLARHKLQDTVCSSRLH